MDLDAKIKSMERRLEKLEADVAEMKHLLPPPPPPPAAAEEQAEEKAEEQAEA